MEIRCREITIWVQPWLRDHRVAGRVVFPAVESLLLLADVVRQEVPSASVWVMEQVRFARFLEIPDGCPGLPVQVECGPVGRDAVRARLLSRLRLRSMSRMVVHGEALFSAARRPVPESPATQGMVVGRMDSSVSRERIYGRFVPFGPTYQTLQELSLAGQAAWGRLQAPGLPLAAGAARVLGSPFPLDGAMHAACVHGQGIVDFVPFPVAIARRIVYRPTGPGQEYAVQVRLLSRQGDELSYDLVIADPGGTVHEIVQGLRMRNIGLPGT